MYSCSSVCFASKHLLKFDFSHDNSHAWSTTEYKEKVRKEQKRKRPERKSTKTPHSPRTKTQSFNSLENRLMLKFLSLNTYM